MDNQTQPPEYNIPEQPHKNWFARHILAEVLGVAIFAALLTVGYYIQTIRQIPSSYDPIVHKAPTLQSGQSDVPSDWKTYTNAKYGFEFKYPENLFTANDEKIFWMRSSSLKIYDGGGVTPEGVEGEDWVPGYEIFISKQDTKNLSLVSEGEYNVVKLKLPQIEAYGISGDVPSSGPSIYIKNPKLPNSFIEVGYNNGLPNSSEVDKVFNQILSTFKFTQ